MTLNKVFVVLLLAGTVLLPACREEEQGRQLSYQPGVYQGKADAQLSQDALRKLRARGQQQAGAFGRSGGSGPAPEDESRRRQPVPVSEPPAEITREKLDERLKMQNF